MQSSAGDDVDGALDAERQRSHHRSDDDGDDPFGNLGGVAPSLSKSVNRDERGEGRVDCQKKNKNGSWALFSWL